MGLEKWTKTVAENFCFKVTDGTHDSPKKVESGKYLITSKHLKGYELDFEKAYLISNEDFLKINERSKVDQWDVLISMIGTVGEVYLESNPEINYAIKNVGLFKFAGDELKAKWFYYFLKSRTAQEYIHSNLRGTTQQYLTLGALRKFPVHYPKSKREMKKIIRILDSIDKKIHLNNQINKKLEAMAQAIFKSWFIDFEPFQDGEFVESELGMIPKGWRSTKLQKLIEIHDSKRVPLSKTVREKRRGIYPYYGATGVMDYVDDYLFDGIHVLVAEDGSVVDEDDHPIVQYVWGRFWVNNHAHVLRGKGYISEEYIYLLMKSINIRPYITGAVQLKLNQSNLKRIPVVLPPEDVCRKFNNMMIDLFKLIKKNKRENQTLTSLRDLLLPKLMSGEIRVPLDPEGSDQSDGQSMPIGVGESGAEA